MKNQDELAKKLLELDEEILKAQLGIRAQQLSENSTGRSASLESLDEDISATARGFNLEPADLNFGDSLFKQLNAKFYNLMCGEFVDEQLKKEVTSAFQEGSDKAVALLTPILISHLGLASSIAMIVATLILKTLVSTTSTIAAATSDTICEIWNPALVVEPDLSSNIVDLPGNPPNVLPVT
ncbi:hypothetical protein [Laspinema olomoucense]|uniref:hypothetical protein n=1 Tax=Laspinema olomoucense TaxID=3231600 RepID=UPI0021BB9D91|nr:hypothetical protein [Laspinema sp. D3d]MCT7975895.1 hypothetical protein [Laspinema sp. D3d]